MTRNSSTKRRKIEMSQIICNTTNRPIRRLEAIVKEPRDLSRRMRPRVRLRSPRLPPTCPSHLRVHTRTLLAAGLKPRRSLPPRSDDDSVAILPPPTWFLRINTVCDWTIRPLSSPLDLIPFFLNLRDVFRYDLQSMSSVTRDGL
jgi:hypothetical protein